LPGAFFSDISVSFLVAFWAWQVLLGRKVPGTARSAKVGRQAGVSTDVFSKCDEVAEVKKPATKKKK